MGRRRAVSGWAAVFFIVAAVSGALAGAAAGSVVIAMMRDDYSDVWDWDDSEEA